MEQLRWRLQSGLRYPHQRNLFMFVQRNDCRYVIYRIDALDLYLSRIPEAVTLPLVVFRYGVLPNCDCAFAYIKPYFYIVGENKHHVFVIEKKHLLSLSPSKNARGAEFVSPISTPMSSDKSSPLAFAYNNNLYVLSKARTTLPKYKKNYNEFELYSPSKESWSPLGSKPLRDCDVDSYVVIGSMVYFTTSLHVVISFSLDRAHWATIYDPYGLTYIHKNTAPNSSQYSVCPPTFKQQILLVQNDILASVSQHCFNFCVCPFDPSAKSFLRPIIGDALYYSTCGMDNCSSHVINFNENIMCGICYGVESSKEDPSSYVVLTFFKVPQSSSSGKGVTSDSLVSLKEDDTIHTSRILINTKKPTHGIISSCFYV